MDKRLQRDTAYIAYARSLLEQIKGNPEGTYVLILWRKFAWNSAGSPIKGFELSADNILLAVENVKNRLEQETI